MSKLIKRKIIALSLISISILPSILKTAARDIIYIDIFYGFSIIILVALTILGLKISDSPTYLVRRKQLDEREQEILRSNIHPIYLTILGFIVLKFTFPIILSYVGVYFSYIIPYEMYFYSQLTPIFFFIDILLFVVAVIIAIPLFKDKYIDDEDEEAVEKTKYFKILTWCGRAFAVLFILGLVAGGFKYSDYKSNSEKELNFDKNITSISTSGRFNLQISIEDGPTRVLIKGPKYLVDKFEAKITSETGQSYGGTIINEVRGDYLSLISTSRKSTVDIFGELSILVKTSQLTTINTAYHTDISLRGGCMTGDNVAIIKYSSKLSNFCTNEAKKLTIRNFPDYSYYGNSNQLIDYLSVFGTATKTVVETPNVDISNLKGDTLVLPQDYIEGGLITVKKDNFRSIKQIVYSNDGQRNEIEKK
jgi:hypothetical protein